MDRRNKEEKQENAEKEMLEQMVQNCMKLSNFELADLAEISFEERQEKNTAINQTMVLIKADVREFNEIHEKTGNLQSEILYNAGQYLLLIPMLETQIQLHLRLTETLLAMNKQLAVHTNTYTDFQAQTLALHCAAWYFNECQRLSQGGIVETNQIVVHNASFNPLRIFPEYLEKLKKTVTDKNGSSLGVGGKINKSLSDALCKDLLKYTRREEYLEEFEALKIRVGYRPLSQVGRVSADDIFDDDTVFGTGNLFE